MAFTRAPRTPETVGLDANDASALREGDRVRLVAFHVDGTGERDQYGLIRDVFGDVVTVDDNVLVVPGTEGTVGMVDGAGTAHVAWDSGARLGLLPGFDRWEKIETPGAMTS